MVLARPAVVDDELVASIVAIYVAAEERLIALMAAKTKQGLTAPSWQRDRLAVVQEYRRQAERITTQAGQEAAAKASRAVSQQYNLGTIDAVGEMANALKVDTTDLPGRVDTHAVARLAERTQELAAAPARGMATRATVHMAELVELDTTPRILPATGLSARAQMQAIAVDELGPVVTGAATRQQQAQQALNRIADRGITGFVDRGNRAWKADTYVEMAMRTELRDVRIAGHTDRLQQYGHDLVQVSGHKHGCELCAPWEGAILSLSGMVVGVIQAPNVLTGEPVMVEVKGTLDDARAAGLHHPNCAHSYVAYQPGVTDPMGFGEKTDPQAYIDRQALRKLERDIRAAKRVEAAALDPAALREAKAHTRAISAKIKAHTETTGVTRRRYREQLSAR